MRESVTLVRKLARPAWAGVPGKLAGAALPPSTIHLRVSAGQPV